MDNYVKVAVLDNEIESQILDDILSEQDIPHIIRSYYDDVYGNLFQISNGWGSVYAPKEYEQEIKETLEEIRKGAEIFEEDI